MQKRPLTHAIIDNQPVIPLLLSLMGRGSWLLPKPYGYCSRNPRATPTSCRPEKEAASTSIKPSGSAVLDGPAHDVVSLAGCLSDRQTRSGGGLASGRL